MTIVLVILMKSNDGRMSLSFRSSTTTLLPKPNPEADPISCDTGSVGLDLISDDAASKINLHFLSYAH